MPIVTDEDRAYFWNRGDGEDHDRLHRRRRPGRSSGGPTPPSPTSSIEQLAGDEAIAAADTLLVTVPNQLGVAYNAHLLESILRDVAPGLGWR